MYGASRRGHASVIRALRLSRPSPIAQRFLSSQTSALNRSTPRLIACTRAQPFNHFLSRRTAATATAAATPEDSPLPAADNGPVTKFKELETRGLVCKTVVNTLIRKMNLETMTDVQSATINETLKGDDVLAQARTGTGKTLAFLIPVLQRIIAQDPKLEDPRTKTAYVRGKPDIRAIIISPTRELAEQIAMEARRLVDGTSVAVQTAVGGTGKRYALGQIQHHGCHILVGTPGRLNDILSDPGAGVAAPNLDAFVLDEADRLLDDGFAPEITNIKRLLPKISEKNHQTLMVSATVPKEVMRMVKAFMRPGYRFVRTVQEGEQQTHERVPQTIVNVRGSENMLPALLELVRRERGAADPAVPFKAMVFFNANADVHMSAALFSYIDDFQFRNRNKLPIIEINARLSQRQRTDAAKKFRETPSAVLFSSDVTSRGMDFPNVTHVIQMGVPQTTELYIHRIGRTARGNKQGQGWLLSTPIERVASQSLLHGLPLQKDTSLQTASVDMTKDSQLPEDTARCLMDVLNAAKRVPPEVKENAFRGSIGVLQRFGSPSEIIAHMNSVAVYGWGMDQPPGLSRALAARLNLLRVPGLHLTDDAPRSRSRDSPGRARQGFDRGGSSGGRYMQDRGTRSFGEDDAPRRFEDRGGGRPGFDAGRDRPRSRDDGDDAAPDDRGFARRRSFDEGRPPRFVEDRPPGQAYTPAWASRGRIGSKASRAWAYRRTRIG